MPDNKFPADRLVKTQLGVSETADFEKNTWTFKMSNKYNVRAGKFAIVDQQVYHEAKKALTEAAKHHQGGHSEIGALINSALKLF